MTIQFFLDGTNTSGTFVGNTIANAYRGDVVNVCGGTVYHGYNFTIPGQYVQAAGNHTLYAYALDNSGAAPNTLLGARSFTVAVNQPPVGNAESLQSTGGSYVASGWACDPDNYGAALTIHFFIDGQLVGSPTAGNYRGDVASSCGGTAYHGYSFTLPSVSSGTHTLVTYAVDTGGYGPDTLLGSTQFTVPRPDLLYGYYYGCADYAAEEGPHINMWWAVGDACSDSSPDWSQRMTTELQAARAAGATSIVLQPFPGMVFTSVDPNAQANAATEFQQLADTGLLDGWSSIMIYPQDEPDVNGYSDAQMTDAVNMLRNVAHAIPQLAQAKFGVIYNCQTHYTSAPGYASFDWIGCDDYGAGCGAVNELKAFPIATWQRWMTVPGGSFGQNPQCFLDFAENDARVGAVVPFLWQTVGSQVGIRDNGMRQTYCLAGKSVTGKPGSC